MKAVFRSFTIENFSKPGDNLSSFITGITVEYSDDAGSQSEKYVVKLNPQKSAQQVSELISLQFKQEVNFLNFTVPTLNSLLEEQNQLPLRVPEIVHYDSTDGREVIFLKDIRKKGFVLTDRLNTLDKNHVKLVIKEYGRIHAASRLLFGKYPEKTIEKFKLNEHPLSHKGPADIIRGGIKDSIDTCMEFCKHPRFNLFARTCCQKTLATERLRNIDENIKQVVNFVHDDTSPFLAIIHHDCWFNNYMFR